jgi:hypothetical protein
MNGIYWCKLQEGFEVWVNDEMIGFHVVEDAAVRLFKRAGGVLAPEPAPLPAEPVTVTERVAASRARCCHYKAIKACFAVFIERGLPTDDEGMRATLSRLLGRDVATRKALTAGDWEQAASAARWLPA